MKYAGGKKIAGRNREIPFIACSFFPEAADDHS
jgi:hypothetical protein